MVFIDCALHLSFCVPCHARVCLEGVRLKRWGFNQPLFCLNSLNTMLVDHVSIAQRLFASAAHICNKKRFAMFYFLNKRGRRTHQEGNKCA